MRVRKSTIESTEVGGSESKHNVVHAVIGAALLGPIGLLAGVAMEDIVL